VFFYFFIKLNGEIPHPFEKFLFKKNDNVSELKGGCPVNGIASELPMQRIETFILFLTMEMNEHGYKIKGPH